MPLGETNKGGKSREPAVPVDRAKRDQAKRTKASGAISIMDNITVLFDGLFMLTIKDNANEISKAHLNYLVRYCAKFLKSEVLRNEYEFGKQGRIHVHAVLKAKNGKMPCYVALMKYMKKYEIFYEEYSELVNGHLIERRRIDVNSLTIRITPIKDENHKCNVDNYIVKEKQDRYEGVEFID